MAAKYRGLSRQPECLLAAKVCRMRASVIGFSVDAEMMYYASYARYGTRRSYVVGRVGSGCQAANVRPTPSPKA